MYTANQTMTTPWHPPWPLPDEWQNLCAAHPSELTESTNLAATAAPRPTIVPSSTPRRLSSAQLCAAWAACGALAGESGHRGFWLGDATGVGKGRTIAAILVERDTAASSAPYGVWVTTNTTLLDVAARDIDTVAGDDAAVRMQRDGSLLLCTYGTLRDAAAFAAIVERLRAAGAAATIVFDEAHAAISERSAVGKAVRTLQRDAPEAGVVYSTATAASQVSQLGYMERLGMWGRAGHQFATHAHFASAMKSRGPAALELLSLDLKRRGVYIARAMAASSTPARTVTAPLTQSQRELYDACCEFWAARGSTLHKMSFFRQLITALKVPFAVARAEEHLQAGRTVIFSLQHTGASARMRGADSALREKIVRASDGAEVDLAARLPLDTIDRLRDALRHHGVVELSGRASDAEMRRAVQAFQRGDARVALVTSAASQGLSLHASCGVGPRVHMMLELPWTATEMQQQCGRACRSGQDVAPLYEVVVSGVPAEARFTFPLEGRLANMGGMTRGDMHAAYAGREALREHGGELGASDRSALLLITALRAVRAKACERGVFEAAPQRAALRAAWQRMWARLPPGQLATDASRLCHRFGPVMVGVLIVYTVLHSTLHTCDLALLRDVATISQSSTTAQYWRGGAAAVCAPGAWTPAAHALHPPRLRREIKTLLLCTQREPFARLPHDIVLHIAGYIGGQHAESFGTDAESASAWEAWVRRAEGRDVRAMVPSSTKAMMNTILELPIAAQGTILANARCVHAHRHHRAVGATDVGVQTLDAYVLGQRKIDMYLDVAISRVGRLRRITVQAAYRAPRDLQVGPTLVAPRGGTVIGHGVLPRGACYILVQGLSRRATELWLAGRARPSRQDYQQWATLPEADRERYVAGNAPTSDWYRAWRAQGEEYGLRRAQEAAQIGGYIDVATERALDMWDRSQKRVVRCQPPHVPQSFTCLVVESALTRL